LGFGTGDDKMTIDLGFLLVRLIVGLAMAAHGAQKLFGWFGGHGLKGTGGFFEGIGFRPGVPFAAMAGAGEFFGGLLIALGLFGPAGAMLVIATMLVAILAVHASKGFWQTDGGYELNTLYIAGAIAAAFAPMGTLSLDSLFGLATLHQPAIIWSALALGVLGGLGTVALRRPVEAASAAPNKG
jgi:putative oxidoreductase